MLNTLHIAQAWDSRRSEQDSEEEKAAASLEACCASVEQLGMQLYPNDAVFPEPHVCLRLELAAAGKWPEPGLASKDDSRVPSAMLKVPTLTACPHDLLYLPMPVSCM